jgi:hypothetical protein
MEPHCFWYTMNDLIIDAHGAFPEIDRLCSLQPGVSRHLEVSRFIDTVSYTLVRDAGNPLAAAVSSFAHHLYAKLDALGSSDNPNLAAARQLRQSRGARLR